ncbi:S2-RNase [Pyrus ussuriensis x Pyrus communis]|uniref:S2-RNase n=1 Tax=Pyrus ussuriensis x Pyrus communis TaxID=2448454 RepID=A0A5N5I9J0_9ROSA|nr:S2-RNase [Pyrus ussuriensis x Pyrus communis]
MAFHEQFYRVAPEMIINDLVEVKQFEHESIEDFMMRFRITRMRCQFPINHGQLISIAQKVLRLPLRKKFYDVQFNELQELVIVATKYEKLLIEEQQVKHSSKVHPFYKNKAAIHQLEFEETELEESDGHGEEGINMCAAEMTTPFKPLMVKGLVQSVKGQKVVTNDDGFVPIKHPKYQSYSFDLTKMAEIYEDTKKMPKLEELKGKKYCKLHYTFNHSITNCIQFRDWIHDLMVKGKVLLEKPHANMMIDTYPFPETPTNMINQSWAKKGKGKATWEGLSNRPKATIVKKVVLCSKCQCECKLEVLTSRAIIDQELARISIMRVAKKETSRNVFPRLGRDSQPNGLSEVFRNYEASEDVEDKEAKMSKGMDVRPS